VLLLGLGDGEQGISPLQRWVTVTDSATGWQSTAEGVLGEQAVFDGLGISSHGQTSTGIAAPDGAPAVETTEHADRTLRVGPAAH